ncbi:MAG: tRNA (uridine(54)-C5)-methyltransferase TrmA [Campylobacter sp.]|nr:tRNA (uridine(54)-C5)-methyltransferase TrmA [Campylobacter sp.]
MECKHFGECGSCTLGGSYDEQKDFKISEISNKFAKFYKGKFDFFASKQKHYRIRAEFGIWHDKDDIYYTMHSAKKGEKILIGECPKVALPIANLMQNLLILLKAKHELRHKLFGVEFLSCSSGILLSLLYHKNLDENFLPFIKELDEKLGISVLARSRGVKLQSRELNLQDILCVDEKKFTLNLSENAFTQPNKAVNEKMLSWARSCIQNGKDLLELYCGHGNFTIALSEKFKQILATEVSKSSVANAHKNCEINGVNNIKFLRMDADELMAAFDRQREFRRLKDIDIFAYDISHVLVDPPRAGLSQSVINFIKKFQNIIYISCNPTTLEQNLNELCQSHEVQKFAIFDQFAHTFHTECGVLLKAKNV